MCLPCGFMLKINHCFLGLAVVGITVSLSATPVRAESKLSQCKRFNQTMALFTNQMDVVFKNKSGDPVDRVDRALAASEQGLKQIQARKFTDRQIQSFQTQAANLYIDMHNNLVNLVNAAERQDRPTAEQFLQKLRSITPREKQLYQQFAKYCRAK
jgi:hypothetical protein